MRHTACILLLMTLTACAQAEDESTSAFNRAKTLIEANCADCSSHSQPQLEEGIHLALKARNAGYADRAATLRLLVDGYGTLGAIVLKPGDPKREEALKQSSEFLKQLVEAAPSDANARYDSVHRIIGGFETITADIDERITQYRRILALDPKHEKARFDLAQDLFLKGEDDEALQILRDLRDSSDPARAKIYAKRLDEFLATIENSRQVVSPEQFPGEVFRGQNFEREFGPGLLFRLEATDDSGMPGWEIQIVSKDSRGPEYSSVLTPPYRGMNVRYLFVGYGLTAKQVVEGNRRSFRFVRNRQDYDRARANVAILLGRGVPEGETYQDAFDRAAADLDKVPYCIGFLRILDSRITSAEADGEIDWLKFDVELCGKQRR